MTYAGLYESSQTYHTTTVVMGLATMRYRRPGLATGGQQCLASA